MGEMEERKEVPNVNETETRDRDQHEEHDNGDKKRHRSSRRDSERKKSGGKRRKSRRAHSSSSEEGSESDSRSSSPSRTSDKDRRKKRSRKDDDGDKEKKKKKKSHKKDRKKRRHYSSEDDSESDRSSGSESSSDFSDSETDSERERRARKRKKERSKEKKSKKDKKNKKNKDEKKHKHKHKHKKEKTKGAVTAQWGMYGILKDVDMWSKRPEFSAWLTEVKQINLESMTNREEKDMFKEYMEDYNTATLPSKKYYNIDAWHRQEMMRAAKSGYKAAANEERTVFNDEEMRRAEIQIERAKQKEEDTRQLLAKMGAGMAEDMREQERLRTEMEYLYRVGRFEEASAIQKRLAPDDPATAYRR